MKRIIWKILLLIGVVPFGIVICGSLYSTVVGSFGLCITNCSKKIGSESFVDSIILYSYICWPMYIIGIIFIIMAFFKLKNGKC